MPSVLNTGGRYNPISDNWVATSTTNAPEARTSHTAVWTGSEMIVWGGFGSIIIINTGGRYNPSTDSWTATSMTNAPSGRFLPTAVWTGSEMIVWGGADPSYLNTGGKYTPGTDSWVATSMTNAPDARDNHTAVWTGSEMVVWGGLASPTYFNTGGRYNPSTDGWVATSTANAPSPRYDHTAIWSGSEMIVWGGTNDTTSFNTGGRVLRPIRSYPHTHAYPYTYRCAYCKTYTNAAGAPDPCTAAIADVGRWAFPPRRAKCVESVKAPWEPRSFTELSVGFLSSSDSPGKLPRLIEQQWKLFAICDSTHGRMFVSHHIVVKDSFSLLRKIW